MHHLPVACERDAIPDEHPESSPSFSFLADSSRSGISKSLCSGISYRNTGSLSDELILDISGMALECDNLGKSCYDTYEGLYMYKNEFSLLPRSLGRLGKLKTLKFFGNDVKLFPTEGIESLRNLECLQVKVSSSPGIGGLGLLDNLKELELMRLPCRPSVLTILNDISGLKCLTKLSVCHFSIRYLPPEIGCLKNLEILDLSYNKLKFLPSEISLLSSLLSLRVANNKLLEVPSCLSMLQNLEHLDLSNNRLTTLDSLELDLMANLYYLNLQNNKLVGHFHIPGWLCCSLDGNDANFRSKESPSSLVEMDIIQISPPECYMGSYSSGTSSNIRNFAARKSSKRWKRRDYLLQKARQERLNSSRKWKNEGRAELMKNRENENKKSADEMSPDKNFDIGVEDNCRSEAPSGISDAQNEFFRTKDDATNVQRAECLDTSSELNSRSNNEDVKCNLLDEGFAANTNAFSGPDEFSSAGASESNGLVSCIDSSEASQEISCAESSNNSHKSKRHCDGDLDYPKPYKCQRPCGGTTAISKKYNDLSYCGILDFLPDGFYDAGRDRPFMPLTNYEQNFCLNSREVILLDREKDEELDALALSAQALVSRMKRVSNSANRQNVVADDLQIVSWLALFVSDHFGGSDRNSLVDQTRKIVSGSNYDRPFICTCSSGSKDDDIDSYNHIANGSEFFNVTDLCEKSLQVIKGRKKSIIVPLGSLRFGVCRHRALLMKYLCDRMRPPIPCELVRGYLDFYPHAWNIILVKKRGSYVRMVVDPCSPLDIRDETDLEFSCRYIPLNRVNDSLRSEHSADTVSPLSDDEIENTPTKSIIRCKFGSIEAAAKIRKIEVLSSASEDVRNLELSFLGEVRILGALRHPSIVQMFGHQLSSKWLSSNDGGPDRRIIHSAIFMEYVDGGSLKEYIDEASKTGKKRVPLNLALCIAKDVSCALMELHTKHIIHRDIKSENILFNPDCQGDGRPVVKLCDFDRAVPLRSHLHKCCIAHVGNPPPNVCVGTPRWMAPEVLRALNDKSLYGLEVDIWSYGCLLLELLTLQIPYSSVAELRIHELIEAGERPPLDDELEALAASEESSEDQSDLKFLAKLFRRCTDAHPQNRPSAADIYSSLVERTTR